jgi:DNA uptake protein ComE-like DNA-binding protein
MFLREFFYFNKSDRRVILFLLTLAVSALVAFFFLGGDEMSSTGYGYKSGRGEYDKDYSYRHYPHKYYYVGGQKAELFPFDPNTADSTELLRLGLRPWQVRNIYKYRSRGGIYRTSTDFARLYGLTQKQFREMQPYIRISSDYQPASLLPEVAARKARHDSIVAQYPMKIKAGEHVQLNSADTAMLQRVPGIGSYYAHEIEIYRRRLGGFSNVEQLKEIDGFPESALKYFTTSSNDVAKINVNKLSLNQLKRHPYISFYQARDIVDYRRLRGPLKSLDDLRLLKDFPPEAIERLRPYVEF